MAVRDFGCDRRVSALPSAEVIRLPVRPRPRVVAFSSALDCLVADGILDAHQHAAALAYAALRRRYERSGGPMRSWRDRSGLTDEACHAAKRDHARMIQAARAERFMLDRLCLDDDTQLLSEVGRVRAALERVVGYRLTKTTPCLFDVDDPRSVNAKAQA